MEEVPQTRAGILKLQGKPVQTDIFLRYEKNPDYDKEKGGSQYRAVKDDKVTAWLHPLAEEEWVDVEAIGIEAYRASRRREASHEDSNWKGNRAQECQQLYYCIRRGSEEGAERLFIKPVEVFALDVLEVDRLIQVYNDAFIPTREETKNSLRERLGLGSPSASSSPNTSATPVLSSQKV